MSEPTLPVRETFGFSRDPFAADPTGIWLDHTRRDALEDLHQLIARKGFAALTGPPGSGKTILLGRLCSELGQTNHRVIYIACAHYGPADILRQLCVGLGLEPTLGASRMRRRIQERVAELKGIIPVAIVDEAQSLPQDALEVLKVTCSAGIDGRNPFALILAGAEDLHTTLSLRLFEPLRQRITLFVSLHALSRSDTVDYVRQRLQHAGVERELFSGEATTFLFEATAGVPRRINKLADEALRRAAREKSPSVAIDHVRQAARRVFGPTGEADR